MTDRYLAAAETAASVQRRRRELRLSQHALAERANLNAATVSHLEGGAPVSQRTWNAVHHALATAERSRRSEETP